ncbi:MAG: c-type cytochrome [Pyrinomonadaceae bacterium]
MKTKLRFCAFLAVTGIGIFAFASSGSRFGAVSAGNLDKPSARELYVQNCARCHGSDGRSQNALGRKLEASDLAGEEVQGFSSAKITHVIRNGRPDMPAFGKKLSAPQIAALAAYVRSL